MAIKRFLADALAFSPSLAKEYGGSALVVGYDVHRI